MRRVWTRFAVVFATTVVFSGLASTFGCGVEWRVPSYHFDGVDVHGYVAYSEKIGEMDLGDDLKMPIIIDFQSDRGSCSPYLGQGWLLTLVESKMVQTGENSFEMYQPDGWIRGFGRAKATETLLSGQGGWKAKINGPIIEAYAECGWKLTFTKGKITSIVTPKNRQLDFIYFNGKVAGIQERNNILLRVEFDPRGEGVSSLVFNNQRIQIAQNKRPIVDSIGGQNVIAGMTHSLSRVASQSAPEKTFQYSTTAQVQPTLEVATAGMIEHKFVWDSSSKRIISDHDWAYQITPGQNPNANATIKRTNAAGQNEFWSCEYNNARETVKDLDGVTTVTERFTSGLLNGKFRRAVKTDASGKIIKTWQVSYNEFGQWIKGSMPDSDGADYAEMDISEFIAEYKQQKINK